MPPSIELDLGLLPRTSQFAWGPLVARAAVARWKRRFRLGPVGPTPLPQPGLVGGVALTVTQSSASSLLLSLSQTISPSSPLSLRLSLRRLQSSSPPLPLRDSHSVAPPVSSSLSQTLTPSPPLSLKLSLRRLLSLSDSHSVASISDSHSVIDRASNSSSSLPSHRRTAPPLTSSHRRRSSRVRLLENKISIKALKTRVR